MNVLDLISLAGCLIVPCTVWMLYSINRQLAECHKLLDELSAHQNELYIQPTDDEQIARIDKRIRDYWGNPDATKPTFLNEDNGVSE